MNDEELNNQAVAVRDRAYSRYSGYSVGAALLDENGHLHLGCNVENAAYPQGSCAETGAIAAMVAAGETELIEVLVIADAPRPVTPCGGCRQKLAEFARHDVPVTMCTTGGESMTVSIGDLLPAAFDQSHMER